MSSAIGTVTAKVIADTKGFKAGINSSVNDMRKWQRSAKQVFESTRTPVERFKFELAKVNALHKKGHIDATTHARAVKQLNASYRTMPKLVGKVGAAFASVARSALLIVGPLAAVGALFKGLRVSEDIARSMNSSLAIMGEVSEQMKAEMADTAQQVASDTIFSTAEASKAYYFLTSAGLDAAQSLKALPTVAKFAQAGMFNLSTATDLLTDAQMALGMASKDAQKNLENMTHVGDVLVKANTIANASVRQFSESLTTKAAAAARRFKKDIEEVTATLAVFASRGIKGVDAGTQYDIVLRHLSIKAIENAAAFKAAGVAVYGHNKQMRNLADIIADLEVAMKGMGAEQEVITLMSMGFTAKTISAMNALLGTSEAMREYEKELRRAAGTMDEVSGKQMTQFQKGWARMTATISNSQPMKTLRGNVGNLLMWAFGDPQADFDKMNAATARVLKARRDAQAGAAAAQSAQIETDAAAAKAAAMLKLAKTIEAAHASADDLFKSLQFTFQTSGMDSYEKALYKIEQQYANLSNIDKSRLEDARRLTEVVKEQAKALKQQEAAMRRGAALTKSFRTPKQVMGDTIADLKELWLVGAIDAATYARARDKARADFAGNQTPFGGVPANLRGGQQARQTFVSANDPLLRKADERNRLLRDLIDEVQEIQQPKVADLN